MCRSDDKLSDVPYYHPGEDSEEVRYMKKRREELGGFLPQRKVNDQPLEVPELDAFRR
jgi:pyruvate dehydrogenase E1 component